MSPIILSDNKKIKGRIRYVNEVFPNGWLTVLINGTKREILEGTKVRMIEEKNGREYFTILEGKFEGKQASVSKKSFLGIATSSYLTTKNKQIRIPAQLVFDVNKNKLSINGLGTFNAITHPKNPIPKGTHFLELPDEIHNLGSSYTNYSRYAKTWFRIGLSGDRYLHCGSYSAGCIAVTDWEAWTEIYKYLRYRRNVYSGKTIGVGFVVVK